MVNAGAIIGNSDAVQFAAGYNNLLIVDPGASFSGIVDGGNTIGSTNTSTLELASGASTGTVYGLGSQFINFANVVIDSGATWTLTGSNTIASGVMITVNGTLIDDGSLINDSTLNRGTRGGVGAALLGCGCPCDDRRSRPTLCQRHLQRTGSRCADAGGPWAGRAKVE